MRLILGKLLVPVVCVCTLLSCGKKDDPAPAGNGSVKLEFFNNVGSSALNLDNQWYINTHGDSFKVSRFEYYISNVKLNGSNSSYNEPESYHLLQQGVTSSMSFDLSTVPSGTYASVTFTIGVDSLRNVSGAQTGALDPVNGMFWTWNTGYIMLKMEGTSPKSASGGGALTFHAGGFSGANSVVRTVTLTFANPITVSATSVNHVHLDADVLALFRSPNPIDFSVLSLMNTTGEQAKKFADNYANMFSVGYAGL